MKRATWLAIALWAALLIGAVVAHGPFSDVIDYPWIEDDAGLGNRLAP